MFNSFNTRRRLAKALLALALPLSAISHAGAQRALVTRPVDDSVRVALRGNVHPLAMASNDLGPVADNEATGTLMMVLGRGAEQQTALDSFAKSASMAGTSQYRNWMTPQAFAKRFGAGQSDLAQVTSWLEANGLKVEKIASAGNIIRFSGNMGALRAAFHTEIHRYQVGESVHLSNSVDPTIPAALAPAIRGVVSMNDFRPKSGAIRGPHATHAAQSQDSDKPRAQLTVYGGTQYGQLASSDPSYDVFFLPAAGDAAIIYDTPNSAMNPIYKGTTWTGSGVTIGIAGDSNFGTSTIGDIANYRSLFLNEPLAQAKVDPQLPKIVVDGDDPGENGDEIEALLDVEQAMAFAPKALITFYTSADGDLQSGLFLAMQRAIDDNAVSILNVSFGACEANLGAGTNAFLNELYEQAAAQGITITVSTGDSGSAGCDAQTVSFTAGASGGLSVNGLASTPWNVAVGGTDFDALYSTDLSDVEKYIQVPGSVSSQVGTPPYYSSALGYIPEQPWNDSTTNFTTYAQNTPYKWGNGPENTIGGGGGVSSSAVCSGTIDSTTGACSGTLAGYAKPVFQTSITPADKVRDVPDVSFFAGAFMSDGGFSDLFNASWSLCSDSNLNGEGPGSTDCLTQPGTEGCGGTCALSSTTLTTPVGGTSAAAPSMAGILALVIQSQGGQRLGQADYALYNLASTHPSVFHDITQGNNAVLCTAGTTNCGTNDFMTGYNAGTGYDLASGIGSIDAAQLVNNWSTVKFTQTTTTVKAGTSASSLSSSALTVAHGATVYFQVGVTPSTATGFVALISNNAQPNSDAIIAAQLVNGVASFSTQALHGGTYMLYAQYAGDNTNAGSKSQGLQLTVSSEASSLKLNINAYDAQTGNSIATPVYGSSLFADITPYGSTEGFGKGNPATGTVTLSYNGTQIAALALNSTGVATYQLPASQIPTAGSYSFTAAYSGDSSYSASTATGSITLAKAVPVVLGPSPNTSVTWPADATNADISMGLDVWSLGVAPTGTVAVTMNGTAITGSPFFQSTAGNPGEWVIGGGQLVTPAQIGVGNTATFTITYSGDANYQGTAPITETVTVSEPANAAIALTNSGNLTISAAGQSGTGTVTVTPSSGFEGPVALTCALSAGGTGTDNPTCSIASGSSVTISGTTAQNATITISTKAASSAAVSYRAAVAGLGGSGLLAAVFMIALPRRRRTGLWLLALLAIGCALVLPTACGGGSTPTAPTQPTDPGTPAGSYTFTITGTHGSITGTTTVTVALQ